MTSLIHPFTYVGHTVRVVTIDADRWLLDEAWHTYYAPEIGTQGVLS